MGRAYLCSLMQQALHTPQIPTMTQKTKTRRPSALTEKQQAYVDAKLTGQPVPDIVSNPVLTGRSEKVQAEIARARQEVSDLSTLKRLDVIEGILDGINTAKFMSDAGNIIRGWTEIAKILGHYAPEVKKVEVTVGQARLRSQFEMMSDEELLAISEGKIVIDHEQQ